MYRTVNGVEVELRRTTHKLSPTGLVVVSIDGATLTPPVPLDCSIETAQKLLRGEDVGELLHLLPPDTKPDNT